MEKYLFTIQNIETGKLNALVNNIMKQTGVDDPNEAIRLVNSGEWTLTSPVSTWTEKDSIIYSSVTSDGTTGEQWIARLESKDFQVEDCAESVLRSKSFKPTSRITYKIAVLKGELLSDDKRIIKNIRKEAENRKFLTPDAEIACLIREKFSDKELEAMGLYWIVTMHESIKDSDGVLELLTIGRSDDGSWLDTSYDNFGIRWDRGCGFAFVIRQVSDS